MKLSLEKVSDAITKWSLYSVLFLTPIFFLPLTPYPVDLNKQFVFSTLVFVAAIAWLVKCIKRGKAEYPKHFAGILLMALVGFTIFSAFFSGARSISMTGITGGEADTALAIISFAILYFLIAVSFKEKADFKGAFLALMASGSMAVVYAFLQAAGTRIFPWDFAQGGSFNPVGTINAFGLYVGFIAALSFAIAQYMPVTKRMRVWTGICAGASFIFAILIGYWALFVSLIIVLSLFVVFSKRAEEGKASGRAITPLLAIVILASMLVIALGFVAVPVPRIATPADVVPSVGASLRIALATAQGGVKNIFLGSGPAMYQYEYVMHRDAALNATAFWNVQFMQGFNAILTHLVSWGIFGTVLFLLFLASVVLMVVRLVANRRMDHATATVAGLTIYAFVTLLVYPQNFVLYVLLFACAGMVAALFTMSVGEYGVISFSLPIVAMFMIAILAGIGYVNSRHYIAALQFERGIQAAGAARNAATALPFLSSAVLYDAQNDGYWRTLASAYLARANAEAAANAEMPTAKAQKNVTDAVAAAVTAAERATQVNPRAAGNWIALAQIYEAAAPFNKDAAPSALAVYGKAASLDPLNPAIPTYIGNAERAGGKYDEALASFEKALALKADYAPAHFAIIQMFDANKQGVRAAERADQFRALISNDANALFQLGVLHYEAGRFEKAREVLEQAVSDTPDYANALYFLGRTYEKLGDNAKALVRFERVLQLNPDNAEIKAAIEKLRTLKKK